MGSSYRVDFNEDGIAFNRKKYIRAHKIFYSFFIFFRVIRGYFGLKIDLLGVLRVFLSYFQVIIN